MMTSLLGGRISKVSLPTITGRPQDGAPRLKRLLLDQGELSHLWDGEETIRYIAFLELRQDTIRGNHFHKLKREFFYLISGEVEFVARAVDAEANVALRLIAGDRIDIQTGVAHSFKVVAAGQAIEFSPALFNADDIYPFVLIPSR